LTELERERDALRNSVSAHAQLPLFAASDAGIHTQAIESSTRPRASDGCATLKTLRAVDPNDLSPREALELVFRLQQLDRDAAER
jgi:hypothetical protein